MLGRGGFRISLLCVTPAASFLQNRWLVRGRRGLVCFRASERLRKTQVTRTVKGMTHKSSYLANASVTAIV